MDDDEGDNAVPAIVIAEYRVGVLLDGNRTRAAAQERFLEGLLTVLPVVDYSADDAMHHASSSLPCVGTGGHEVRSTS